MTFSVSFFWWNVIDNRRLQNDETEVVGFKGAVKEKEIHKWRFEKGFAGVVEIKMVNSVSVYDSIAEWEDW